MDNGRIRLFCVSLRVAVWRHIADGVSFQSVPLTSNLLAKQFGKTTTDIVRSQRRSNVRPLTELLLPSQSRAITLTLLFRSVGAVIFGFLSDRFGRKWTLVVNCEARLSFQAVAIS